MKKKKQMNIAAMNVEHNMKTTDTLVPNVWPSLKRQCTTSK